MLRGARNFTCSDNLIGMSKCHDLRDCRAERVDAYISPFSDELLTKEEEEKHLDCSLVTVLQRVPVLERAHVRAN